MTDEAGMTDDLWCEQDCLSVDPFAGDFGDGEILFSDRIVTAAKRHDACCNICGGSIEKGERHRARREAWNGSCVTTRFCASCCAAMAISRHDDGRAWEARVNLHRGRV